MTTRTALRADLHRLPDVGLAQGTFGHWSKRYKARQVDKNAWIIQLLSAGLRSRQTPLLDEPVQLRVKVYYPTAAVPDIDNILHGLKGIQDLLEPLHMRGTRSHGWLGWIANDRLIKSVTVERFTDASRAPLTQLHMEAV